MTLPCAGQKIPGFLFQFGFVSQENSFFRAAGQTFSGHILKRGKPGQ
jgi:hypothetical protein